MKKIVGLSLMLGLLSLASASDAEIEALAVAKCGECHLDRKSVV